MFLISACSGVVFGNFGGFGLLCFNLFDVAGLVLVLWCFGLLYMWAFWGLVVLCFLLFEWVLRGLLRFDWLT